MGRMTVWSTAVQSLIELVKRFASLGCLSQRLSTVVDIF